MLLRRCNSGQKSLDPNLNSPKFRTILVQGNCISKCLWHKGEERGDTYLTSALALQELHLGTETSDWNLRADPLLIQANSSPFGKTLWETTYTNDLRVTGNVIQTTLDICTQKSNQYWEQCFSSTNLTMVLQAERPRASAWFSSEQAWFPQDRLPATALEGKLKRRWQCSLTVHRHVIPGQVMRSWLPRLRCPEEMSYPGCQGIHFYSQLTSIQRAALSWLAASTHLLHPCPGLAPRSPQPARLPRTSPSLCQSNISVLHPHTPQSICKYWESLITAWNSALHQYLQVPRCW